jgi:lipopolysaccharide exporter
MFKKLLRQQGMFGEAVKGISWMGLLRGSTRLIAFGRIAVLARLLTPEQFGVYGVASLVLALLEVFTETGINIFLVQDEGELEDYVNTAWIVSIVRGAIISLMMFLGASVISSFFNSPDSYRILVFMSLIPLLRGFINPSIVKFQKNLAFNKEFYFRFSIYSFDALTAIIFAFITRSATSLVWGLLAGVILEIILSFALIKPRPKLAFESTKVKKVIHRGKWLTAAGIFQYFFHEGDDWVVGKLLNTTELGTYQIAYKISSLPIYEVGEIFNKVTFPVYSKIKSEPARLRSAFYRVTLVISALVIPFGLILFFFTKPLVLLILGNNWLGAVPVIKVLAIFGIIRAITGSAHSLYLGVNKQEYATVTTLVSILGLALTIIPLVLRYGIVGAGFSALIGSIIATPVMVYYVLKILKLWTFNPNRST